MSTVLPILIIVALGGCAGLLVQKWTSNRWISAFGGAGIATALWTGGVYLLLWVSAPNELGPPLFEPILSTFLTALASATVAVWVFPKKVCDTDHGGDQTDGGHGSL